MNKKGELERGELGMLFFAIGFILLMFFCLYICAGALLDEYREYKTYEDFCSTRTSFCYCSPFECEFKTSSYTSTSTVNGELVSSDSGMSEDTKALCALARSFDDKKTLFKVGCE